MVDGLPGAGGGGGGPRGHEAPASVQSGTFLFMDQDIDNIVIIIE